MNISLSKFAKDTGVSKTTVHRRCNELGIETASGLDEVAVSLLCNDLGVSLTPDTCNPTPDTPSVTVDPGNHEIVLAAPQLPTQFSLEGLRSSEVTAYDDPLEVANRALAIADQIQTAMQGDLEQRQQRLQATKHANQELQKRIQAMRLKQLSYELQAHTLDSLTTEHTASLGDAIAELTQLGKPEQTAVHGA